MKEDLLQIIEKGATAAEKRIESLEGSATKKMNEIMAEAHEIELDNLWDKHYLWDIGDLKVHTNALQSLILYLEKSIKYNRFVASPELCLDAISSALDAIQKEERALYGESRMGELHNDLGKALSKLNGHDGKRVELMKKAKMVLQRSS